MDGSQDETKRDAEAAGQRPGTQDNGHSEATQAQVRPTGDDTATQARSDCATALVERGAKIAELEGEIAEVVKTAKSVKRL